MANPTPAKQGANAETRMRMYEKAALRAAEADDEVKFEQYCEKFNAAYAEVHAK